MHELGIASEILASMKEALSSYQVLRVRRVKLIVGHLQNVDAGALRFAFDVLAREEERFRGALLEIEEEFPVYACRTCGGRGTLEDFVVICPACGEMDLEVSGGNGIVLQSIEADEERD